MSRPSSQSGGAGAGASVLSYAASAGSSVASYLSPLIPASIKPSSSSTSSPLDIPSNRDIDRFYHVKVRPLLDAVDQLRGLLQSEPIKLPTIVVVGDQSSGKSSVLEALSGVALPRGQNITTRCPLVLRLHNLSPDTPPSSSNPPTSSALAHPVGGPAVKAHGEGQTSHIDASTDGPRPYAYLSLTPLPSSKDVRLTNFDDIGPAISALTTKVAGHNKSISATPLYLSVYRAHSPDLTLVDLPGLTRNPVGDQPRDIYHQIQALIRRYIEPVESVILNVMPASVDMTTCECVMMSKEVDPEGLRSIGVVTKTDLAEKGIRRKLEQGVEQLGLQMGVVAVRCRSQEEIDRGVSWEVSREMERQFFRQHPELSTMADESQGSLSLGIPALAALLTTIQEQKIRQSLPTIRATIRDSLMSQRQLLQALPPTLATYSECRMKTDNLLTTYLSHIAALARGDHSVARGDTKLHLSPRLSELYTLYMHTLQSNFSSYLTLDYARVVHEEIRENTGVALPNFLSHQVFEGLMRREMRKVAVPSSQLVEGVRQLLSTVLGQVLRETFVGYGGLAVRLTGVVNSFLDERQRVIMERLEELQAEEEELFTQNPYYLDTVNKVKAVLYDRLYGGSQKDREERERAQERKEKERSGPTHDSRLSQGKGWLMGTLSSAVPTQLQPAINGGAPQSSMVTFTVNDLTLSVDLAALTLPLSSTSAAFNSTAAATSSSSLANLLPSNVILDMQINCYAYSVLAQKRLADAVPLLIRYHFVKGIVSALGGRLHREIAEMGEKALVDQMREEKEISAKRERLQNSVARLDKALAVIESL